MLELFNSLFDCVRRRKGYFIFLLITSIVVIVLAVFSAINFDGGVLPIDLSNIPFIRYLKDDCSFFYLIFGSILSIAIFVALIILFNSRRFLIPFAIIFYLYFVYSQIVIFVSLILIYGFFSTLILIILLTINLIIEFLILLLILTNLLDICDSHDYFKSCFSPRSCILTLFIITLIWAIIFAIILAILRTYVILLIF